MILSPKVRIYPPFFAYGTEVLGIMPHSFRGVVISLPGHELLSTMPFSLGSSADLRLKVGVT